MTRAPADDVQASIHEEGDLARQGALDELLRALPALD
jgi:hypothetical protein